MTPEQSALLEKWYESSKQLAIIKAQEMELRKIVVNEFFDPADAEGTKRYDLPDGYRLKVVKKQNYKLENDEGQTDKALENVSDDMAAMLVKWTPTLSLSNFKKLTPEYQAFFNDCLEITDAAPSLEIEDPKTKK